jgi:hypothetical protein
MSQKAMVEHKKQLKLHETLRSGTYPPVHGLMYIKAFK